MKSKMFKKVYIEITNVCNLNCHFCLKSSRERVFMSFDKFKYILNEIKPYTDYVYFHVLGEPLMHPDFNKYVDEASKDFFVNVTTNGFLINKIKTHNIRQINISLHSFDERYGVLFEDYISNIFSYADNNSKNTYINYRLWSHSKYYDLLLQKLEDKYDKKIILTSGNFKLDDNVFLSVEEEFTWPQDSTDECSNSEGVCYALKDHIAILSNGTVVPCCLDGNGVINLGNIFEKGIENIINSSNFIKLKNELSNGIRNCGLCKKCNFSTKRYK